MPRNHASPLWAAAFAAVAIAAYLTQQFGPVIPPDAAERIQRVNEAIDTLPYLHGDLVATDAEPMAPAIRMLRPERLIQRSYRDATTQFGIVIVFSPDARDLAGHHPPVCYPNAGWKLRSAEPLAVPAAGRSIDAVSYHFTRTAEGAASPQHAIATSFFIVPGNPQPFQSQMRAVEAAARDRRAVGLGAVHVMVLISGDVPDAERDRILSRAGDVLSATIERIAP